MIICDVMLRVILLRFQTYVFFALLLVTHLMSLVLCSVVSAPLTRLAIVFLPTARKEIR